MTEALAGLIVLLSLVGKLLVSLAVSPFLAVLHLSGVIEMD